MDRALLSAHLEQAERHVLEGARRIEQQQQLIVRLKGLGRDTSIAEAILKLLTETQAIFLKDAQRIRALASTAAFEARIPESL